MQKYLNRKFAKKLLITGAVLFAISVPLSIYVRLNTVGKAGNCFDEVTDTGTTCNLDSEQVLAYIVTGLGYLSIVIIIAGLVLLVVSKSKRSQP